MKIQKDEFDEDLNRRTLIKSMDSVVLCGTILKT